MGPWWARTFPRGRESGMPERTRGWHPVITRDGRQPQAALKWSWLISDFKCLWSYSKSSRSRGNRPGTSKTSARLSWSVPHHLCSLPNSPRQGGVSSLHLLSLSLTPPAKGCLLQPKANLILSPLQFPWLWAMVDASHAELVKPIRGPAHRAGCVCCHMTSCLQPAGAQGQRHRSQPRYVCPSHGWTDGRAGSWKQWV